MKTSLLLTLLAATLPAAESENEPKPKGENPPVALAQKLQATGVKSVAIEATTFTPEIAVTGQVLDPVPLLSAYQEWLGANLGAITAEQEWERLKKLQATGGVSTKLLQTTEAEAKKSQGAAFVALQKLRLLVGSDALQQGQLESLLKGLGAGELALLRLDLPLAAEVKGHPSASVAAIFGPEKSQTASWLGQAPMASPLTLGPALLYKLEKPQPGLRPGAAVQGKLGLDEKVLAWFVPESAVLRADGKTFVYRETGETGSPHARCPVKLLQRTERHEIAGWLVSGSLKTGDKVVSQEAFTLLARESQGGEDETAKEKEKPEAKAKSTEPTK